ncbi:alpha/beta fold hydrolase [Actinomadura macrotermitis]|uniref:Haloalkane dehalogenase n=1 Tax=Actinomadura macrotermitis TaxID=2585200 RepID=A0A7K0BZH1_9ACTN|nr:alpha/beta hydrolase [Actinomadura macrotermitis]MQY06577.1 Haloalkane dehalogenase [Actinomadura macrotermitis]
MPIAETPAGPIEYTDTGGTGPVVVLTHGFPMNHLQWRKVVPLLPGARCIAPTLPLGSHRTPMRPGADLSQEGQARILADFLDALGLEDVTLVMNDWGGPQFLVALGRADRVGRMVFVACEAFDNFPPPHARPAVLLLRAPGGAWLLMQLLRTPLFRHGRKAWGAVSRTRIPDDVLDSWFEPARRSRAVRRDLRAFGTGSPPRRTLLAWSEALRGFDRPALVVWAGKDVMMPRDHGRRLAELLPQGRLVEVADSATLIPEDRPEELAQILRDFLAETAERP